MGKIATEAVIVLLLIIINGVFSMSELAIISAKKNRLLKRAEKGDSGAQAAVELAENPNRFLSTVQIGISLIGVLSGAFGGATLAGEIGDWLNRYPALAPYSEGIGVALVVLIITYLSLVLGELVPKRLALNNAEGVAAKVSRMMKGLSVLATPLVNLLSASTELVLRIVGPHPSGEPAVTEEDVRSMMRRGAKTGVFEKAESEMVDHIFRLGDRRVSTTMTPRTDVVFVGCRDTIDEIMEKIVESGYSRYPVCDENPDNVIGFVQVKHLFEQSVKGKRLDINSILEPALFVPENMTALDALERMQENGSEIALVLEEYGGVTGLVSFADILNVIVGDRRMRGSGEEPEIIRREDGSLLLDGMLPADELKELLHIDALPDEGKGYYETLNGMLMTALGQIPVSGSYFDWEGYRLEVMDMDGHRIDKVLVAPLKELEK